MIVGSDMAHRALSECGKTSNSNVSNGANSRDTACPGVIDA